MTLSSRGPSFVFILVLSLSALSGRPACARLVQVSKPEGMVWINVPEPASTRFARPSARAAAFRGVIAEAAARCSVDARLVEAVIACESDFDTRAVSAAGAMGLMQLMPDTAAGLGVADPFDVDQNIDGGTRHLAGLLRSFDGDTRLAVAAYNAGESNVRRAGGIPPFPETQHYVRKVESYLSLLGSPSLPEDRVESVAAIASAEPAPELAPPQPEPPRGHRVVMARDAQGRLVFVNQAKKDGR
jgi:soluble lytic murein transglycosylase-like protein